MAITTLNGIVAGLGASAQQMVISKASQSNQTVGGFTSLWRATGTPGQAAIPAAAAIPTSATTGAYAFTNPAGGVSSYLGRAAIVCSVASSEVQIHDRLSHMGGLSGTVTTAQTVSATANDAGLTDRRGASDYSDVQWWLEWYTDTGATGVTATVTYTNAAGTTNRTTTVALAATMRAGRMLPIIGQGGEFIQSVQSVTLSATTGTAGSFGVTATRVMTSIPCPLANVSTVQDWAALGMPRISDSACLFLVLVPGNATTGTVGGTVKLIQG